MIDVSVIIPTFNRSKRLVKALVSVAEQQELPAELIVVDDGSTDATQEVVTAFSDSTSLKCRYHFQSNRGPAAARNSGIGLARSKYLAFLDSDDQWHRDKLAVQYEALASSPEYLISHTMERWYRNGEHLNQKKHHIPLHGDIFSQALRLCCVGMSTVMAKRELFDHYGLFDDTLRCCEDYDLWLRISAFENFYLVDNRFTVKHGGRPDQVSHRFRVGMDRFRIQALSKLIMARVLEKEQQALACIELEKKCTIYARGCAKHDKNVEASYYFELADFYRSKLYPR